MIKEIDYYSHEGISLLNYVDRFSGNVAIPYYDFYQRKTNFLMFLAIYPIIRYLSIKNSVSPQ